MAEFQQFVRSREEWLKGSAPESEESLREIERSAVQQRMQS